VIEGMDLSFPGGKAGRCGQVAVHVGNLRLVEVRL